MRAYFWWVAGGRFCCVCLSSLGGTGRVGALRTTQQVVGYVASGYGRRGEDQVKGDIDRYKVSSDEKQRRCGAGG